MWSSRSTNCITVDGLGQVPHSAWSRGSISAFKTTPLVDLVVGETKGTYLRLRKGRGDSLVSSFKRAIIFIKPHLVVVYDRLDATRPVNCTYWLHSKEKMKIAGQRNILIRTGKVRCRASFLLPSRLSLGQSDQYDPNPRDRIKLREWHLQAKTVKKQEVTRFLSLYHPYPVGKEMAIHHELERVEGGYALDLQWNGGKAAIFLPSGKGKSGSGVTVELTDLDGKKVVTIEEDSSGNDHNK